MIDSESIYFAVRQKGAELVGYVKAEDNEPINGASVTLAGQSTKTDDHGFFKLGVSGEAMRQSATLQVSAPGYVTWTSPVTPGSNEITVLLEKRTSR